VRTAKETFEGDFKILRWAKEGNYLGVRVKGINPQTAEIPISGEDLDAGVASIRLL
jgi:hypothetical protein